MTAITQKIDFDLVDSGPFMTLTPMTATAHKWVAENLTHEETLTIGFSVVIEHRYIEDIVGGLKSDGLTVNSFVGR